MRAQIHGVGGGSITNAGGTCEMSGLAAGTNFFEMDDLLITQAAPQRTARARSQEWSGASTSGLNRALGG